MRTTRTPETGVHPEGPSIEVPSADERPAKQQRVTGEESGEAARTVNEPANPRPPRKRRKPFVL